MRLAVEAPLLVVEAPLIEAVELQEVVTEEGSR